MKVFKKIVIGFAALVVLIFIISLFLSKEIEVKREIIINVPPEEVYAQVNDFSAFKNYSPWYKLDTNAQSIITGNIGEKGYKYEWSSENNKVGHGSLTREESIPFSRIKNTFYFKEWDNTAEDIWEFESSMDGASTTVKWIMKDNAGYNPINRWMGVMMDGMIGPNYEKGLEMLKKHCESLAVQQMEEIEEFATDSIIVEEE